MLYLVGNQPFAYSNLDLGLDFSFSRLRFGNASLYLAVLVQSISLPHFNGSIMLHWNALFLGEGYEYPRA
jgi:hypothetical protein